MSVNNVAFLSPAPRPFARRGKSLVKTWKASYFGVRSTECYLPSGTLGVCASGPVLGGCGVHGLYAPGRSGNIVGSFEPGLERESSRAGEPEGCNRIQNTSLRQRGRNEQVRCPEYALPQVQVPGISLLSIGLSTAVVVEER